MEVTTGTRVKGVAVALLLAAITGCAPTGTTLERRVEAAIAATPVTTTEHVRVSVEDGVVSLDGRVGSTTEIDLLTDAVERVEGVTVIRNRLFVPESDNTTNGTPTPARVRNLPAGDAVQSPTSTEGTSDEND